MKPRQPYQDEYPIIIPVNNDFAMSLTFYKNKVTRELKDLTGITIKAQARERRALDSPLLFQFGVSLLMVTPEDDGDPVLSMAVISVDHGITRQIKAKTGYCDILLIGDSIRTYAGFPILFKQTTTDHLVG